MNVLGPCPCRDCGVPLDWDGQAWRDGGELHRCRRPACMTVDEYAAWREPNGILGKPAVSPCADCLPTFALEMRRLGACDGVPGSLLVASSVGDERRRQWRMAARNRRERLRLAREAVA